MVGQGIGEPLQAHGFVRGYEMALVAIEKGYSPALLRESFFIYVCENNMAIFVLTVSTSFLVKNTSFLTL